MTTATKPPGLGRETKHVTTPATLKARGEEGAVEAVFSTFGAVDRDGDVVLASAFTDGQPVAMTWAHDWSKPIGRGTVRVEPTRAVFVGKFWLDTDDGLQAYRKVKAMGELQQYSWGFRVLDSEPGRVDGRPVRFIKRAELFEVSPVLVGANSQTGTLALKGAKSTGASALLDRARASARLITARARAHETLAAMHATDTPEKEATVLKGVIENKGAGRWLLPAGNPDAFADDEVPQLRAVLRQAVQQAVAYREEAMRAQLSLQPRYLLAIKGQGHPSTAAQDRAEYEAAEAAAATATAEEGEARKALTRFEAEVRRRALAQELRAIQARDAERAAQREAARRGAERGLVARVLARGQAARQPVTFGGRPYKH